jgi:type II secretory pathway pseudopilin PulG
MIEVMVVTVIIGIMLNIAMPGLLRARETSRARSCVKNLKNIDGAKEQFAIDNRKGAGAAAPLMTDLTGTGGTATYLKTTPRCPSNGTYSINTIGALPQCTIGANVVTRTFDDHVMQ